MVKRKTYKGVSGFLLGTLFALIAIVLLPFLIVTVIVVWPFFIIYQKFLLYRVKTTWFPKRKFMLILNSDSPVWSEFVRNNLENRYADRAFILNSSRRIQWDKKSLEVKVSNALLRGSKDVPAVIVFTKWYKPKVFSFYKAFKEYKHGKPARVEKLLKEVEDAVRERKVT